MVPRVWKAGAFCFLVHLKMNMFRDIPGPWLLWMPSRLSQLAVVALMTEDDDDDDDNDDDDDSNVDVVRRK